MPVLSLEVTQDEDSTLWQCTIELKSRADWVRCRWNENFTLQLFGQDFNFVVEGRSQTRNMTDTGDLSITYSITGLSPLCRYDARHARSLTKTWTEPVWARAVVQELIGIVTWNLPDWLIPAYRLAATDTAPLTLAQQIVGAVGGLLESQPDGSVVARLRWPIAARELFRTTPDLTLTDFDEFALNEQLLDVNGYNRLRLLDVDSGYRDQLEWTVSEFNDHEGVIRAYPSPWRTGLTLTHTRGSQVTMGPVSEEVRDEEELVEFKQCTSSTRYPVMTLLTVTWLAVDLGSITVSAFSSDLRAGHGGTTDGCSLARITYQTKALHADVRAMESIDETQFILMETL